MTDIHEDTREIRDHVEGLFDAFLAGDRDTLIAGRADDWIGFQIPSTSIVRGRDAYAEAIDRILPELAVERYEFLEFEIKFVEGVALVVYTARDHLATPEGEADRTIIVRSLDVYGRVNGQWTQLASNISLAPGD